MTVLSPMSPAHFEAFTEESVTEYARECVAALRWEPEGAVERARSEFARVLPQGTATPGHHLHEILDREGGRTVGSLWFSVTDAPDGRNGYLFDIRIDLEQRGRGYARAAMAAMEARCAALGARRIGLHVFSVNHSALALYRSLGYGINGYNLIKRTVRD